MKRTPLLLAACLLSAGLASAQLRELKKTFARPAYVLVASHRALHNQHPENSLPAFRAAVDAGIDIIETDVKVTKDGVPVLMHDRTINRTTTGTGDPEKYTLAELRQFHLKVGDKVTSEKIPTLEEALNVTKGRAYVDLDIKTDKIEPVLAVIRKTGTIGEVFFFDDDFQMLSKIDKADKKYMIMPRAHSYASADSALALFKPEIVHIDFDFYDRKVTGLIRRKKARVWINALGEPDQALRAGKTTEALDKLLANGANVIQTDEPALLLKLLKEKGLHP